MELKPGLRLESATCDTQVVVVKAPDGSPTSTSVAAASRCGRSAPAASACPSPLEGDPTLLGKRYADEDLGLELLCTAGGHGTLSVGDTPLLVKGAKPLPSSD